VVRVVELGDASFLCHAHRLYHNQKIMQAKNRCLTNFGNLLLWMAEKPRWGFRRTVARKT
jgi:hypothetical protein